MFEELLLHEAANEYYQPNYFFGIFFDQFPFSRSFLDLNGAFSFVIFSIVCFLAND